MARLPSLAAGAVVVAALAAPARAIDCTFKDSYPRQYVAFKTDHDLVIDGKLDDPAWQEVGFTESFVDISTNFTPKYETRAKIRWDDQFLYVGYWLQEPQVWANISYTCHCLSPNDQGEPRESEREGRGIGPVRGAGH